MSPPRLRQRRDTPSLRVSRLVLVVALSALVGCGPAAGSSAGRTSTGASKGPGRGQVLVSAAASLTAAFEDLERRFEQAHSGVDVVLNLAGSSSLREQILAGAPADVLATADPATMDEVATAGLVAGEPTTFAHNRLQIAVPPGNPAGVTGLADFDDDHLLLGLCAAPVPCGTFARRALDAAEVTPAPDTNEPDVRALVTKIAAGELDAGITYVTDVVAADGAVVGVDIPADVNVDTTYPIAVLADAPNARAAATFRDFVLGDTATAVLAAHGFGLP